ncbi:LOW QUALITY PROTEIN: proline-rich protein 18 [Falco rusticolus]|uniref:LOW QUALITY PROTEIN: proline-rich protein 18 n=1 Tax=Falco rusticolus TaxID=120794 RepID=UPI00188687B5|nr:LOW QUALITY PROTEIN: proline-rich protein 18 [Falco rusticolus]
MGSRTEVQKFHVLEATAFLLNTTTKERENNNKNPAEALSFVSVTGGAKARQKGLGTRLALAKPSCSCPRTDLCVLGHGGVPACPRSRRAWRRPAPSARPSSWRCDGQAAQSIADALTVAGGCRFNVAFRTRPFTLGGLRTLRGTGEVSACPRGRGPPFPTLPSREAPRDGRRRGDTSSPPRAGEGCCRGGRRAGRGPAYRGGKAAAVGADEPTPRAAAAGRGPLVRRSPWAAAPARRGALPPAGRCAALPGARPAAPWARGEEPEGAPGRTASLPPLLPAPAARAQPRKAAAAPKKAAARPAEEKAARKARGAPPERAGPLSSSWPCSSLQRRPPAERGRGRRPPRRSRGAARGAGGRQPLLREPRRAAGEPALRFSLSLPPEAIRVLQRRNLERQRGQPAPSPGGRAAPAPARRGARAGGDLRALLKISLLNDRHRYDDEEYEEEEAAAAGAAVDEGLVRKCTEWLRGVESAAGRDRPDRLETLPHLGTL